MFVLEEVKIIFSFLKGREWKALSDYYTKRLSELIKTGADPNTTNDRKKLIRTINAEHMHL